MGYNPEIGRLFLTSGEGPITRSTEDSSRTGSLYLVDNWIWDGNDWHQVFSDDIAPPTYNFTAAYDPVHDAFFAFADDMRCASRQTQTLELEVLFLDLDNDGTLDYEDECPSDPDKIIPGICGCGVSSCRIIRLEWPKPTIINEVPIGADLSLELTIYNDGNMPLNVYDITCPTGFKCPENFSASISAGEYVVSSIRFAPTEVMSYSGTVLVDSDKTDGMPWIDVTGTGTGFFGTDNDGLPDDWEITYGLDPLIDDSQDDADGHGFSNLKEYLQGTIPNDPQSHPPRTMPWLPLLLE